jgi:SAM-dependent methyltransferase
MISVDVCVFCAQREFAPSVGLVAPFIAEYVLGQAARPTEFGRCLACGGLFAHERYEAAEALRLYEDYRGARYLEVRHRHEFWYTARVNEGFVDGTPARRLGIQDALDQAGASFSFGRALDFGGGEGSLFPDGPWAQRLVVDPSGAPKATGILGVRALEEVAPGHFDLIMACQVLEHLAAPLATVEQLAGRLSPDGLLYVEVPDEDFTDWTLPRVLQRPFLSWLTRRPRLLTGLDLLSVALRRKLRVLPPMGFLKLHEHINFFSLEALGKLIERSGLQPVLLRRHTVVTPSERLRILQCVARRPSERD